MKAYDAPGTVLRIISYAALALFAWGLSSSFYIRVFDAFQNEWRLFLSISLAILAVIILNAIFVAPYRLYDEIGGLGAGLLWEDYTSHPGPQGEYWIGIKVTPQWPMATDVYAVIDQMFYEYGGLNIPYSRLPLGARGCWIDNGNVEDDQTIHIGRGDSEYLPLFQVQAGRLFINIHKYHREMFPSAPCQLRVSLFGKTANGKDVIPEQRVIILSYPECKIEFAVAEHRLRLTSLPGGENKVASKKSAHRVKASRKNARS